MSAALEVDGELDALRDKAEQVEKLVSPPQSVDERRPDEALDRAERRRRWYRRVEDAVLDLSNALPQGNEDYVARKLFEFLVGLRRAIDADLEADDPRGDVELTTMKMHDVVHRLTRRLLHNAMDDPRLAAGFVLRILRDIPVTDVARLLGVSTKTVGAWKGGNPVTRNPGRVVVLAQLLTYLQASMTPRGLVMWFDARREQLGDRTPLELLEEDEATARELLVPLARGARGQLAD